MNHFLFLIGYGKCDSVTKLRANEIEGEIIVNVRQGVKEGVRIVKL